ncbi:4,5-dihydroxyphthalate decarboxylase [Paraburkholderia sp. GV068]|uniref:4,5-dihydroxyphthalate decarboxylase n=1 Tax=unclassified Paraburkholderia TaxID=2615204 RepID=UPI000D320E4A|nr:MULTISPECIES: 4,5-dihydroxyphthalate decarboxylase [unclassified Paraburkholderia]PTQ92983.1 4,5-dihydroxyphthalate decarboxylase [Paraburkholderia sp. GV072]PUA99714.1 4,5-dihydroxyphthalate decarboxylase [Paraburkholderia sp. GV068]
MTLDTTPLHRNRLDLCDTLHAAPIGAFHFRLAILLPPILWYVEEIFYRTTHYQEWDVLEMSHAKYASLRSQGDDRLIGLPVFSPRVFRISSLYVRRGGGTTGPADLRGKRIGVPEWAQTASIYSRGWLAHDTRVPLSEVEWVQAGVNQAGRREQVDVRVPDGVRYRPVADRSLTAMLLAGEIDAILSARPPGPPVGKYDDIVRLLEEFEPVERAYFQATGIFPIMHLLVMRREVFERHRWIANNLLKAFTQAKDNSLERLRDISGSHFPLPWMNARAAKARALFGGDPWPYGVEPNRVTLDAFLRFAHEQGVCHRRLAPEDLFPPEVAAAIRV